MRNYFFSSLISHCKFTGRTNSFVFVPLYFCLVLLTICYSITYLWYQMTAAKVIHAKFIAKIFHAPLSFFKTEIGATAE